MVLNLILKVVANKEKKAYRSLLRNMRAFDYISIVNIDTPLLPPLSVFTLSIILIFHGKTAH